MWVRVVAKILSLLGVYAIVIAGLGMKFSGEKNSSSFNLTIGELAGVTAVFIAVAVYILTRRPKQPLD